MEFKSLQQAIEQAIDKAKGKDNNHYLLVSHIKLNVIDYLQHAIRERPPGKDALEAVLLALK